jgi:hypothetical protein
MPLAEDDDMVKTFPSDRTNQSFRMSILPWRSLCGGPITNAHGAKPPFEYLAVDTVARSRMMYLGTGS